MSGLLADAAAQRAVRTARAVAERVRPVASGEVTAPVPDGYGGTVVRPAGSFAAGALGIVPLLHACAIGDAEDAQRIVQRALPTVPKTIALFDGMSGLLVVLQCLARSGGEYASARARIVADIERDLVPLLRSGAYPMRVARETDLISGLSGTLLALAREPSAAGLRHAIAAFLGELVRDVRANPDGADRGDADGALNLGVSHGLAGILAALCSVPEAERDAEAIAAAAGVLVDSARDSDGGLAWTSRRTSDPHAPFARVAWCYGAPGISHALLRAAEATSDRRYRDAALAGLARVASLERSRWGAEDFALCHGLAGIALSAGACAVATGDDTAARFAAGLVDEIVDAFDEQLPYGYGAVARPSGEHADAPGLLTGAAGVALALLTLAGANDGAWASALGIAWPASGATNAEVSAAVRGS
jgi:lantibiotic biosynthesis protein